MALLLAVHLGVVMALFLTLPYGKFAHGDLPQRGAAQVGDREAQPNPLDAERGLKRRSPLRSRTVPREHRQRRTLDPHQTGGQP